MRTLYHVPLVHRLDETPWLHQAKRLGIDPNLYRPIDRALNRLVSTSWQRFRQHLAALVKDGLVIQGLRLYVEGDHQRDSGRPMRIVRPDGPVGNVLVQLQQMGAVRYGIEHPFAMRTHDELIRWGFTPMPRDMRRRCRRDVIVWRDSFIATFIADNLPEGATGMLLLGGDHNAHRILRSIAPDIRIHRIPAFAEALQFLRSNRTTR